MPVITNPPPLPASYVDVPVAQPPTGRWCDVANADRFDLLRYAYLTHTFHYWIVIVVEPVVFDLPVVDWNVTTVTALRCYLQHPFGCTLFRRLFVLPSPVVLPFGGRIFPVRVNLPDDTMTLPELYGVLLFVYCCITPMPFLTTPVERTYLDQHSPALFHSPTPHCIPRFTVLTYRI